MSVYRVTFTGKLLEQRLQNVVHFADTRAFPMTENDVIDNLLAGWLPVLRNLQNNNFQTIAVKVQIISPAIQIPVERAVVNQAGSLAGDPAPLFVSALFSIRTATPGRSGRGRFYMAGVHGPSMVAGKNGAMSSYIPRQVDLQNQYCHPGEAVFRLGIAPRNNPGAFKDATQIIIRDIWGVQRRRNIGVGG